MDTKKLLDKVEFFDLDLSISGARPASKAQLGLVASLMASDSRLRAPVSTMAAVSVWLDDVLGRPDDDTDGMDEGGQEGYYRDAVYQDLSGSPEIPY
jgi:hypothetical protein